jgi:hypothetical protein
MAGDGSAALGAPELAGAMVNPRGLTKTMSAGALGGAVGALAAAAVASRSGTGSDAPAFGRVGYLAASETEVALIKTKSGAFRMSVTDRALARMPREGLDTVEFKDGMVLSRIRLQFTDGAVWEFDVPKVGKKNAKRLAAVLGASVT